MYQKLSEDEIEFCEFFHDPVALTENLIPENTDAPGIWDEDCDCVMARPYQFGMLSYEYMYAYDNLLSPKQNFQNKIGAGKLICIAGRNLGKSFLGMDLDACFTIIHYDGDESCISSFDADHLNPRMERIANIVDNHKFFKMYHVVGKKQTVNRNTGITTKNGHLMKKANERIEGNKVGEKYHGMHYKKFYYDEFSYSTNEGLEKRIDSKHSYGVIERLFGIADLRIGSPLGDILKDPKNKNWICRLPQYVREDWDEQSKEEAVDKYGGENSTSYKLNVEAKLTEGAYSKFDLERIRKKCMKTDTKIKFFEIGKGDFENFKERLVVDRLPCEKVFICSDIGTTGSPSEIIILFGDDKSYKYHYNISLFKLTTQEQARIFKWLYDEMGKAYIALDCTNADGRSIRQDLVDMGVPDEYLSDFRMNRNIDIGLQKDKDGKVILDEKKKPIIQKENTKELAVQLLEKIFYSGRIEIPYDQKLIKQISGFYEMGGVRKSWGTTTEDHLLDSFLLFALCEWHFAQKNMSKKKSKGRCLGIIG